MKHRTPSIALKILLLEDQPLIKDLMEDVIAMEGHQSYSASLPSQALSILDSEQFDLIISDIRMPEMTGIEFGLNIRRQGNRTPIIFYSGEIDAEATYQQELKEIGKATIFDKAVPFHQVAKKLHHYLELL